MANVGKNTFSKDYFPIGVFSDPERFTLYFFQKAYERKV